MSLLVGAGFFLLFASSVAWYYNHSTMLRGHPNPRGRVLHIPIRPTYPEHQAPQTDSKMSGSDSGVQKKRDTSRPSTDDNGNAQEEYYPSLEDVSSVRDILRRSWSSQSLSSRKVILPDEVIDMILDEAEYWPSMVTTLRSTPFVIGTDGDRECLRTPPLCYDMGAENGPDEHGSSSSLAGDGERPRILLHRGMHPCRKIVFDISSHDQGWGGDRSHRGTFRGSYTWFSAYITPHRRREQEVHRNSEESSSATTGDSESAPPESDPESESRSESHSETRSDSSPPRPFLPEPGKLQCNRTATIRPSDYHIVWHYRDDIPPDSEEAERIDLETGRGRATLDGREVRGMKVGDEVSVWPRARFPQWRNHVERLSVMVFWAA